MVSGMHAGGKPVKVVRCCGNPEYAGDWVGPDFVFAGEFAPSALLMSEII